MALLELFSDDDEGGKVNLGASRDNGPGGVVYSNVEANLQMMSFIYLTLASKEFLTIYLSPILLFSPTFLKQEKDFPPILLILFVSTIIFGDYYKRQSPNIQLSSISVCSNC